MFVRGFVPRLRRVVRPRPQRFALPLLDAGGHLCVRLSEDGRALLRIAGACVPLLLYKATGLGRGRQIVPCGPFHAQAVGTHCVSAAFSAFSSWAAWLWMHATTRGWYDYYVFELPRQRGMVLGLFLDIFMKDILNPRLLVALIICIISIPNASPSPKAMIPDVVVFGSLVCMACRGKMNPGGYDNHLMPLYAGVAIYFGIGVGLALERTSRSPRSSAHGSRRPCFHSQVCSDWPQQQLPSIANRQQGLKIMERIAEFKGEVFWCDHPW